MTCAVTISVVQLLVTAALRCSAVVSGLTSDMRLQHAVKLLIYKPQLLKRTTPQRYTLLPHLVRPSLRASSGPHNK